MRAILWTLAALSACAVAAPAEKKIVCYFQSWSVYRPGNGQVDVSDIDPTLCTHLIYAFAGINLNGEVIASDAWADLPEGKDGYNKFNRLRDRNPKAKTLIAIGGWNDGSIKYSLVAATPSKRKALVENAVKFVKKYRFDGLDFDWEYPNQRGGVLADRKNFVLLLKELKERFDKEGLILSGAVSGPIASARLSYDIPEVSKYLSFLNVMTYDFHGVWDKKTGINAPLYAGSWEKGDDRLLNVNASINYWIREGTPGQKIIVGIPSYGRTFTLDNINLTEIGAPASLPGIPGPYTREYGSLSYLEICEMQKTGKWAVKFNEEQSVPFAVQENQWVGYDDARSIKKKIEYVKSSNLGGVALWGIDTDDMKGFCGVKYPLLSAIKSGL